MANEELPPTPLPSSSTPDDDSQSISNNVPVDPSVGHKGQIELWVKSMYKAFNEPNESVYLKIRKSIESLELNPSVILVDEAQHIRKKGAAVEPSD